MSGLMGIGHVRILKKSENAYQLLWGLAMSGFQKVKLHVGFDGNLHLGLEKKRKCMSGLLEIGHCQISEKVKLHRDSMSVRYV